MNDLILGDKLYNDCKNKKASSKELYNRYLEIKDCLPVGIKTYDDFLSLCKYPEHINVPANLSCINMKYYSKHGENAICKVERLDCRIPKDRAKIKKYAQLEHAQKAAFTQYLSLYDIGCKNNNYIFYVAIHNDTICGVCMTEEVSDFLYVVLLTSRSTSDKELYRGIGRKILHAIINDYKDKAYGIYLEADRAAVQFYLKMGFLQTANGIFVKYFDRFYNAINTGQVDEHLFKKLLEFGETGYISQLIHSGIKLNRKLINYIKYNTTDILDTVWDVLQPTENDFKIVCNNKKFYTMPIYVAHGYNIPQTKLSEYFKFMLTHPLFIPPLIRIINMQVHRRTLHIDIDTIIDAIYSYSPKLFKFLLFFYKLTPDDKDRLRWIIATEYEDLEEQTSGLDKISHIVKNIQVR